MTTTLPLLVQDAAACCSPVTGGVLDQGSADRLAQMFKALGDPTRVRLLSLIAASDDGEACICDLTAPVNLSQPTVSHHMKQLVEAGLVEREQRGKWAYYRVVDAVMESAARALMPAGSNQQHRYLLDLSVDAPTELHPMVHRLGQPTQTVPARRLT